jgi:hypothetical protein
MTDLDLERRLRAWYRADGDADGAPPQLRADLAAIGQEAESRRTPTGWRLPRMSRSGLVLAATALVAAVLIGLALFLGQPPNVGPTGSSSPTGSASAEPSTTQSPGLPLGGGLIITYQPHVAPGACSIGSESPVEVYTVDVGTGAQTILGALCAPRRLAFQWASDRVHVLMTDGFGQEALKLDSVTPAGREVTFICCNLPTDVWQGGSGTGDGWVLSPAGDRVAAIHTSVIQYPGQEGVTGIADGIVVANIDGSGETTFMLPTGADAIGGGLSWSPDQSALVVPACLPCNHAQIGQPPTAANRMHLFVVPVDGSGARDVIGVSPGSIWGAAWSADGSRFAAGRSECQAGETTPFCDVQRITSVLELVDATDGSEQVLVRADDLSGPFAQMTPAKWSPRSSRIAFSTYTETGGANVFVIDADGGNVKSLGAGDLLGWSPDGEWLLVMRPAQTEFVFDAWVVRVDGTDARPVGSSNGAAW